MPKVAKELIDRRRREMTLLLRDRNYLPVAELCRKFGISEATARRDLSALSRDRRVVRTFGGAMVDYERRFAPFADRLKLASAAKARIASAAAAHLKPGDTVFLDAGTTLFAVADVLKKQASRGQLDLHIVTNNLAVAEHLAHSRGVTIDLLGGRMLWNQSVLLGAPTCRAAAFYRYDWALLGAEGIDGGGVWNSAEDVVALQRAVASRATHYAVCADARKLNQSTAARLFQWNRVDRIITDAGLNDFQPFFEKIRPTQVETV